MRIAYIYTALTTFGGVDRVLTTKANYLAEKMNYDVYIITDSQAGRPPVFPLSPKVHHIDLETDFDEQYHYNIVKRYLCYRRLMKQYKMRMEETLSRIKPDITITTCGRDLDFLNSLTDGSIKMGESHTTKAYMRNLYLMKQKGFPYSLVARHWEKKMENEVKKLRAFIVLNEHDAKCWREFRDVTVIPNAIPFTVPTVSHVKNKRIISVGRFSIEKGIDRTLEIWKEVAKSHPEWRLDWYGEGQLIEDIQQKLESYHLRDSFHFNKPVQNIQDQYLQSDIYMMCSRHEAFPMVLLEAMSCGLPCIAFDCPFGPRSIITDGKNGFLVEDGNVQSYVNKLSKLMDNIEMREKMSKESKIASENYSQERIMQKWDSFFRSNLTNV